MHPAHLRTWFDDSRAITSMQVPARHGSERLRSCGVPRQVGTRWLFEPGEPNPVWPHSVLRGNERSGLSLAPLCALGK